jgi:hypothetical protein
VTKRRSGSIRENAPLMDPTTAPNQNVSIVAVTIISQRIAGQNPPVLILLLLLLPLAHQETQTLFATTVVEQGTGLMNAESKRQAMKLVRKSRKPKHQT